MNGYTYTAENEPTGLSNLAPTITWREQGSYVTGNEDPWKLEQVETACLPNPQGPPEVLLRLTFANGRSVTASTTPAETPRQA